MNNKESLEQYMNNWIPREIFMSGQDLDGKAARIFLESYGYTVIKNYDTGRNGLAITSCGVTLSTNGYMSNKGRVS